MATFWSSPAPPVPGVPLPLACKVLLVPAAVLFVFGMVRLHYNLPVFRVWIREDGLVEWLTVAVLAALGSWADRRIGTSGIFTIIGALVGFVGTMLSLIRQLSRKDGP